MSGVDVFLEQESGNAPNEAEIALQEASRLRRLLDDLWTVEPALVKSYDAETQRVSLKLKNHPDAVAALNDVPVLLTGGDLAVLNGFKTIDVDGEELADSGLAIFSRTDVRHTFDKHDYTSPFLVSGRVHDGSGCVFLPGPQLLEDVAQSFVNDHATATDLDQVGPGDSALVHRSGSRIVFKENGEVIIKATKLYIGSDGANVSSYNRAARHGDGTDGTKVTGGSTNVFLGD